MPVGVVWMGRVSVPECETAGVVRGNRPSVPPLAVAPPRMTPGLASPPEPRLALLTSVPPIVTGGFAGKVRIFRLSMCRWCGSFIEYRTGTKIGVFGGRNSNCSSPVGGPWSTFDKLEASSTEVEADDGLEEEANEAEVSEEASDGSAISCGCGGGRCGCGCCGPVAAAATGGFAGWTRQPGGGRPKAL